MYYFQYPVADTTLYEGNLTSSLNSGRDEILEVQKIVDASGTVVQVSRFLIKFDSSGNKQWTKQFGTSSNESSRDVFLDNSGNV